MFTKSMNKANMYVLHVHWAIGPIALTKGNQAKTCSNGF